MAPIAATMIFVLMFVLIVMDKIKRHYVTLGCGLLTLVVVFGLCMHSIPVTEVIFVTRSWQSISGHVENKEKLEEQLAGRPVSCSFCSKSSASYIPLYSRTENSL